MSRIGVLVIALLMAVALSGAGQIPVSMVDFAFSPDTVRVNPGDSVIWTNNGTFLHTSTSGADGVPDGLWNSGNMAHGATFVHPFPANGTFNYYCAHHYLNGMKGVVVVGASGVNEIPSTVSDADGIASFPNPFRAGTTINLAPNVSASGSVSVFDASGKLVRTLPVAHATSVTWNGRDSQGQETGPGVYFCRCGSGALALIKLR